MVISPFVAPALTERLRCRCMQTLTQRLANPTRFMELSGACCRGFGGAAAALIVYGLYLAFFASPADYQQGETVRIMYIHVPCAWLSMMVYALIAHLELRAAGVPPSPGRRLGKGRRADRRRLHVPGAVDRIALGQADVGHVLGVGCAADVGADPVLPLSRPDGAARPRSRTRPPRRSSPPCWLSSASRSCRSSSSRSNGGTRCISRRPTSPRPSIQACAGRCW